MQRTLIKNLKEKIGQKVFISGFVQTIRKKGKIIFLEIRDISGVVQATVFVDNEKAYQIAKDINLESVVEIAGIFVEEQNSNKGYEIKIEDVNVLSLAEPALPIAVVEKKSEETNQSTRFDWRWIDLRKPEKALIFKVWTTLESAFRNYCISNGFIEIHSPKTVVTSTESGSELFEIKYFDKKAYLAQSPQLYKQMAMSAGFEKVFEVGPVFRANPSFTSRHDTEFTMYDIELSFIKSHEDLMQEEEKLMGSIFKEIKEKHGNNIKDMYGEEIEIPTTPFPRLTLSEVKKILADLKVPNERGDDLSPEEERVICQYVKEKYNHDFVFIHEWPSSVRAFYSMRMEGNPEISKSFDLLYRGIEITSGAQREHRYEQLKKQIEEKGFDLKAFESYLNFFKYGCPPHGGFAPGPSRILMKIFGLNNVREVTYLYRGVNRITP